jgi:hypothetical protein
MAASSHSLFEIDNLESIADLIPDPEDVGSDQTGGSDDDESLLPDDDLPVHLEPVLKYTSCQVCCARIASNPMSRSRASFHRQSA